MDDNAQSNDDEPQKNPDPIVDFDEELRQILEETPKQAEDELFDTPGYAGPRIKSTSYENPTLSHELYHATLQKLLRKYLPTMTKSSKSARLVAKEIRRLVSIYLKEGKKRGADGKMAYNHRKATVASVVIEWVNAYGGANFSDLYSRLKKLCEEEGYDV